MYYETFIKKMSSLTSNDTISQYPAFHPMYLAFECFSI